MHLWRRHPSCKISNELLPFFSSPSLEYQLLDSLYEWKPLNEWQTWMLILNSAFQVALNNGSSFVCFFPSPFLSLSSERHMTGQQSCVPVSSYIPREVSGSTDTEVTTHAEHRHSHTKCFIKHRRGGCGWEDKNSKVTLKRNMAMQMVNFVAR